MEEKINAHKGHRQRLKEKVRNNGLKVLSEHEMLELLLTYTIPQKDTNELAHELINKFGSISGVLDTDFYDLIKVVGVGSETALFLNIIDQMIEVYKQSKSSGNIIKISTIKDMVDFFRSTQEIKKNEYLYMYGLNKKNIILNKYEQQGIDDTEIKIDLRAIINRVFVDNVSAIFLVHTHPQGAILPSMADIQVTNKLKDLCDTMGVVFHDHLIINEDEYFSFRQSGLLDNKVKVDKENSFGNKYLGDNKRGK